jgi:hypothetical protein
MKFEPMICWEPKLHQTQGTCITLNVHRHPSEIHIIIVTSHLREFINFPEARLLDWVAIHNKNYLILKPPLFPLTNLLPQVPWLTEVKWGYDLLNPDPGGTVSKIPSTSECRVASWCSSQSRQGWTHEQVEHETFYLAQFCMCAPYCGSNFMYPNFCILKNVFVFHNSGAIIQFIL